MRCTINNDKWEDVDKVYFVHSLQSRPNSTGVALSLEDENGNIHERVVAFHQIEWIEDET
jgi:hypothetical protein